MLATEDTRQARRESTRRRVLKAAWRLVRRDGLAALSLRDLARAVGMRAPSLYSYFPSKNAIYDAMFAEGMTALRDLMTQEGLGTDFETTLKTGNKMFFRFCNEDPARYQLLFQRTIPGFEPSPESYAVSVETLEMMRNLFVSVGIEDPAALDLWTAISSGLTSQQLANDPGGDRWERLSDEAIDMFLAHVKRRKGGKDERDTDRRL